MMKHMPRHKRKISKLIKQKEELLAQLVDVERRLHIAKLEQGKIPTQVVEMWLIDVKYVLDVVTIIEDEVKTTEGFLNGMLPYRCSHSNLGQYISELITEVTTLTKKGSHWLYDIPTVPDMEIELPTEKLGGELVAHKTMEKVWECLFDEKSSPIVVYGMSAVGKTTIMKAIHDRLILEQPHLFDKVVWLTLSTGANIRALQAAIAEEFIVDLRNEANEIERKEQLLKALKSRRRVALFLDDVWQTNILERIGIPEPTMENEWKLLATTRSLEFCPTNGCRLFKLQNLSTMEAWKLFVDKVDVVFSPEVRQIAKWVVEECHGLPLAIVAVAGAMRGKDDFNEWILALNDLRIEGGIFSCLKFCYDRLANKKSKKCFLFCSLFPKDYLFKPDELIRYWMAEKFIYQHQNIVAEIDEGFEILRELQNACMLQIFTNGGHEWLKMNDLFRDLAIRIVRRLPGHATFHWEWAKAGKISMMRKKIERLDDLPNNCSNVSTLLLHDNPISYISPSFFCGMITLKFLDLSGSWITELPQSLSELAQLRVLFLQYCKRLKKLPSVDKLKRLQVLNLRRSSIATLPQGMEELVSLRSLDLSETTKLASIDVGVITSLSCLAELRLQGSGLCKMGSPVVANYLMEIMSLKCLAILTLSIVGYGDHLDNIMCLQQQNHKIFSVDVYGSTEDYIEDEEAI